MRVEGNQSHGSAYDFSGDGRGKFFPLDQGRTKTLGEQRRRLDLPRLKEHLFFWNKVDKIHKYSQKKAKSQGVRDRGNEDDEPRLQRVDKADTIGGMERRRNGGAR